MPLSNVIPLGSQEMASLPLVATIWNNSYPAAQAGEGYFQAEGIPHDPRWPALSFGLESELVGWRGYDFFWGGVLCSSRLCIWLRSTGNIGASVEGPDQGYFFCLIWRLPIWRLADLASHQLQLFGIRSTVTLGSDFSHVMTVYLKAEKKLFELGEGKIFVSCWR